MPLGRDGVVLFRVLGPLEVWTGEAWTGIGAPKWRSLLAALLINAGQVVPTERLVLEMWGDAPPAKATNLVSIYALRLRRLLGEEGARLRTRAPGYQLAVTADDVDALRFGALVDAGRRELARRAPQPGGELLAGALRLWRDEAYLDVPPSLLVDEESKRLAGARLDALELRIEADIACGRHAEVTPELSRLTAENPLREGLWGLLMRALDGTGRHAEALAAYARARETIAEELGVDPGERLQRLFEQILTEDARPPGHPAAAGRGEAASAARVTVPAAAGEAAETDQGRGVPPADPPRQLPAGIADFTGRAHDLERLAELRPASADDDSGAVKIALVTGAGGLGKTTLAVHAAHRLRPHFPDGQLYVNLLGASPQPLAPADVLARFLRDLGVGAARIPLDEDERAALLRTRLTGRQVLLLLDDARDAAQVRPLLPGSASCTVIVTARHRLPDLPVTRLVDLDVLDDAEARALFTSIVGAGRAEAEPATTGEVLAACAGLPLAIRIAGARLAARTGWTVRALAGRLASEQRRLDELKAGDLAVRASFEVSFASLPGPASPEGIDPAQAFRLLGLWPGPMVSLAAAAALSGQPDEDAADALELLVDAHLLESPAPDVYRFHDLLRVYAAERCQAEPEQLRRDALRRILTWYLHSTEAAAMIISPHHARVPLGQAPPGVRPLGFSSLDDALAWCESERAGMIAATRQAAASGMHDIAWRQAAAAMSFYYRHSHGADWIAAHEIGLVSARKIEDRLAEAWMLNNLGMAYGLQHMEEAVASFERALDIYREIDDLPGETRAANNVSAAYFHLRRFPEALDAGHRSLAIQRRAGNRYGEGVALGDMGCAHRELGSFDEAIDCHRQALAIFRELGDQMAEADSLSELGDVYLAMGRSGDAIANLSESLAIWHVIGDRHGQATTLRVLGAAQRRAGRLEQARASLGEAERIFRELDALDEVAEIRRQLADLIGSPNGRGISPGSVPACPDL